MNNVFNVADLVDPNDDKHRTYREINTDTKHTFHLGDLVEVTSTGLRLYVGALTRDCDQTPMYSLTCDLHSIGKYKVIEKRYETNFGPYKNVLECVIITKVNGSFIHGYSDHSLSLVKPATPETLRIIDEDEAIEAMATYNFN